MPVWRSCLRAAAFAVAALTGMFFALVWRSYELAVIDQPYSLTTARSPSRDAAKSLPALRDTDFKSWLAERGLRTRKVSEEFVSFGGESKNGFEFEDRFLRKQVPILCLVLSKGRGKAKAIKETWGRRCNHIIFYANYADQTIPVQRYSPMEPSHVSFCKILVSISGSMDLKTFKWLLISEDSAFVVIENVRKLVAPLDHTLLYYLGRPVKRFGLPAYNALDSGILLSQAALLVLTGQFFSNFSACQKSQILLPHPDDERVSNSAAHDNQTILLTRSFDTSIAQLFVTHNNTRPYDTRDGRGRAKFMAFSPEKYLIKGAISLFSVFWRHNIFHSPIGSDCCSPEAIFLNGVSPSRMFLLDYLLYHTAVFRNSPLGIGNEPVNSDVRSRDRKMSNAMRSIEVGSGSIPVFEKSSKLHLKRSIFEKFLDVFYARQIK